MLEKIIKLFIAYVLWCAGVKVLIVLFSSLLWDYYVSMFMICFISVSLYGAVTLFCDVFFDEENTVKEPKDVGMYLAQFG
ncbi:MAG: hypothetical protein ACKUBY_00345 [Candidatus Moraniibacteriota bacterium]|jgi:hypothetical protein